VVVRCAAARLSLGVLWFALVGAAFLVLDLYG
jgi:hypothetical protein